MKTLKDMDLFYLTEINVPIESGDVTEFIGKTNLREFDDKNPTEMNLIQINKLRQEAIKWIKEFMRLNEASAVIPKEMLKFKSEDRFQGFEPSILILKNFFNIEESELNG